MKAGINETPPSPARRKLISLGLWGILAVIAASAAWPVFELLSRRPARKKLVWFGALPAREMPEVGVRKAELSLRGGGAPDTRVFLRRTEGGELTAFSAVCTHLGCLVGYNRVRREFICPCHAGRYNEDGSVASGPPPKPLARLPVRVEGEHIQVGFKI